MLVTIKVIDSIKVLCLDLRVLSPIEEKNNRKTVSCLSDPKCVSIYVYTLNVNKEVEVVK